MIFTQTFVTIVVPQPPVWLFKTPFFQSSKANQFDNLEWWNKSLFIQIHNKIVEFLHFQAKTSLFLWVSCLNFTMILGSLRPPPLSLSYIIIGHTPTPLPVIMCHTMSITISHHVALPSFVHKSRVEQAEAELCQAKHSLS